tara:strand:- start:1189 stop:1938 length:750 start_codon:yes stop_codon:yes gene_type:complete
MAFLGSLGKALGLGTTQQLVTEVTGNPTLGRIAGVSSRVVSTVGKKVSGSEQGQSTAVSVAPPPQETAFSGESGPIARPMSAPAASFMGGIMPAAYVPNVPMPGGRAPLQQAGLPAIISGGTNVVRNFGGMLGLAGGAIAVAPTIIDQFGNEKKLRVTRRLRSQVKRAVEMFGVEAVADQMGTDVEVIFYILTKKMRNDGPYVTKAAVRKTRQTVRKMKHLCDMYDDLRPAAKRRAPTRTTSRVTQIKN